MRDQLCFGERAAKLWRETSYALEKEQLRFAEIAVNIRKGAAIIMDIENVWGAIKAALKKSKKGTAKVCSQQR